MPIITGLSPFIVGSSFMPGSIGHEAAGLDNPFGDQFVGMDPMDLRHGVFAFNNQPIGGGSTRRSTAELTASDLNVRALQGLFPGEKAPADGNGIVQLVNDYKLGDPLHDGTIYMWQSEMRGEIPRIFSLCELPVPADQAFETLLDINGFSAWMPRVNEFKSGNPSTDTRLSLANRFRRTGSLRMAGIDSTYQSSKPIFQGRFVVDYRKLPGDALQMAWGLDGAQDFESAKGTQKMEINNTSFTLVPVPGNPGRTLLAYQLNVQPSSTFTKAILYLYIPQDNANELDLFFLSLLNRTIDRSWTSKTDLDKLGVNARTITNPSKARFRIHRIYSK